MSEETYTLTEKGAIQAFDWLKILSDKGLLPLDNPASYRVATAYLESEGELGDFEEDEAAIILVLAWAAIEDNQQVLNLL